MTGWYLGVVFDEYLIFPKLEEAGDRLEYSYTIMVEAVLDVWRARPLIMARSESSKEASYMVRKERGLSTSCSAKCCVNS